MSRSRQPYDEEMSFENEQCQDSIVVDMSNISLLESATPRPCIISNGLALATTPTTESTPPTQQVDHHQPSEIITFFYTADGEPYLHNSPQTHVVNAVSHWRQRSANALRGDEPNIALANGLNHASRIHMNLQRLMDNFAPPPEFPPPHLLDWRTFLEDMEAPSAKLAASMERSYKAFNSSLRRGETFEEAKALAERIQGEGNRAHIPAYPGIMHITYWMRISGVYGVYKATAMEKLLHLGTVVVVPGTSGSSHRQDDHASIDASQPIEDDPMTAGNPDRTKGDPYLRPPKALDKDKRPSDPNLRKLAAKILESRTEGQVSDPGPGPGAVGVAYHYSTRNRLPTRHPEGTKSLDLKDTRPFAIWSTSATPHPEPKSDRLLAREQMLASGITPPRSLTPAMHEAGNCVEFPALSEFFRIDETKSLNIYAMPSHDTVVMHVVALNNAGKVANDRPMPLCLICRIKVQFELAKARKLYVHRTVIDNGTGITYINCSRSDTS